MGIDLTNRVALVTGASKGIGRATALALSRAGARVVVNFFKSELSAQRVVNEIQMIGGSAVAIQADVSKYDQVDRLGHEIEEQWGPVEILINNAGVIERPGDWNLLNGESLDRTIDVNLKSTIYCIQRFSPAMMTKRQGRIVNLTTTYAMVGAAPVLAYTAAKAGVIAITYAMARFLGKYGVTVNAIAPGNVETDMTSLAGEEVIQWVISTTPLSRLGKPEEIGNAVMFLATSDFINGHVLVVDGGHILNM